MDDVGFEPRNHCCCTRREAIKGAIGCGAYVALSLGAMGSFGTRAFAQQKGEGVLTEPFARVEKLNDRMWAVVATPKGGMQVVSNSGIIQGNDGVLVVDACNSIEGSSFIAETAKKLTGRHPTHVVLTHFHGDHSNGLSGHVPKNPDVRLVSTKRTRDLLCDFYKRASRTDQRAGGLILKKNQILPNALFANDRSATEIDLGGVTVRLVPRRGHTPSDVTVEVAEPRVVWCGDLVFNGLFPYYGDAIPSVLGKTCSDFLGDPEITYVPGHGPVTDKKGLEPYLALLAHVEAAAREAHRRGVPVEEAWKRYSVPKHLGAWDKFRPDVHRFAFEAWARELRG